jgi:hypothetical protein
MSLPYQQKRDLPVNIHLWNLTDAVNGLIDGRGNVTGEVTLTAGATSTTVTDNKFESGMTVLLQPKTANAAAALTTTYIADTDKTKGAFTITHANNAQVDRTFSYVRTG